MKNTHRFFENRECKYYPCHKGLSDINCLFCYCPLYTSEYCLGNPKYVEKEGGRVKVCTNCNFPHQAENYDMVIQFLKVNNV